MGFSNRNLHPNILRVNIHATISIKVVPKQRGRVEYERERLLGIATKLMILLTIPRKPFNNNNNNIIIIRSYSNFPLCSKTTLIEIAVCGTTLRHQRIQTCAECNGAGVLKQPQYIYIYHLFTETEGNSVFCGPETAVGNNGG
jgi:hypothetical protein